MRHASQKSARKPTAGSHPLLISTGQVNYSPAQLDELRGRITGSIVLPSDLLYDEKRQTFMHTYQHFPQLIVYCGVFSDVPACLAFARETGLYPVCRSGGHSTAGFSANDEMIIDLSGICHVLVDPEARTARVGAGANFAQIDAMLDFYGLHVPGGGCPSVAVGGYMQGGGYGFTSLLYGLNCDNLRSAQLALADGRIVTASPTEHPDLFWAIRGGTGNNFGVLLEATYALQQLKMLFGFGIVWPLESDQAIATAVKALGIWQQHYTRDAVPEHMGHQALFAYLQGVPSVVLRGMYDGPEKSCRDALAPLIATLADPDKQIDIWRAGTYRDLNGYLLSYPAELPSVPMSTRVEVSSRIIADDLAEEAWRDVVRLFVSTPVESNVLGMEAYGRAINAVEPTATAFWHRRASFDLFTYAFWMFERDRAKTEAFLAKFDRVVTPLSDGHSYQNYPNRGLTDWRERYFGGNFERLLEVKRRYDPDRLFRFEQAISAPSEPADAR